MAALPCRPTWVNCKLTIRRHWSFCKKSQRKTWLAGGLTGVEMHGKGASIVGADFSSHWVKQSANTDRESLGDLGPAFVSDRIVLGHIEASQVLVDLQKIDRKSMVSGGLNDPETNAKQCTGKGSSRIVVLRSLGVGILPLASQRWLRPPCRQFCCLEG